jgi:oxygen-dependent protoporphyrinogen oxidase
MGVLDPDLEIELRALRYASCATASLAYRMSDLGGPLESFGFFVPRIEGRSVLACSFVSVKFDGRAPEDHLLVRVFLGGALNPEILHNDDAELARIADDELRAILGIRGAPVFSRTYRFSSAMPQYEVGWPARLEKIRRRLDRGDGLFLAGSAVGAFGLPDCISSGERAAVGVIDFLGQRAPAAAVR